METLTDKFNNIVDGLDVIKKPTNNFTSSVLRRAIPKLNVKEKIGTLSMNKLAVLSAMRLNNQTGSNQYIN
jgi:hypothetical protein